MVGLGLAGCRIGIHTYAARSSGTYKLAYHEDLSDVGGSGTGTAELSDRLHGFDFAARIPMHAAEVELGATFAFSDPRTGVTTGDIPAPVRSTQDSGWKPEDVSFYDAVFVGALVPLATVDDVKMSAYGVASAVGAARYVRTSSGPNFMLEGGADFGMRWNNETAFYIRLGYQIDRAALRFDVPFDPLVDMTGGYYTSAATFTGFTAGIGVRWDHH